MKRWFAAVIVGVVGFPAAAILTWLLHPFWRWIERTAGIEAIGHSGPASWCYFVVYICGTMTALGLLLIFRKKRPDSARDGASLSS